MKIGDLVTEKWRMWQNIGIVQKVGKDGYTRVKWILKTDRVADDQFTSVFVVIGEVKNCP